MRSLSDLFEGSQPNERQTSIAGPARRHKPWRTRSGGSPTAGEEWLFDGMQIDSEKLADQTFSMYHLAPGETIQLRDPDGFVIEERRDESRPFPA